MCMYCHGCLGYGRLGVMNKWMKNEWICIGRVRRTDFDGQQGLCRHTYLLLLWSRPEVWLFANAPIETATMFQQRFTSIDLKRTSTNSRITNINRRHWRSRCPVRNRRNSSRSKVRRRSGRGRGVRRGSSTAANWTAATDWAKRGRRGEWRDNDVDSSTPTSPSSTRRASSATSTWRPDLTQVTASTTTHKHRVHGGDYNCESTSTRLQVDRATTILRYGLHVLGCCTAAKNK